MDRHPKMNLSQSESSSVKHGGGGVMAASGTDTLIFTYLMMELLMNSELDRNI